MTRFRPEPARQQGALTARFCSISHFNGCVYYRDDVGLPADPSCLVRHDLRLLITLGLGHNHLSHNYISKASDG
jgi:hypothetical protein